MGTSGAWAARARGARLASPAGPRLAALLLLNLADALFTLVFLQLHLAEEANPLMRAAYEGSPVLFLAVKLLLVHAGALLLWVHRAFAVARTALVVAICLYAVIAAYHCGFAAWLMVGPAF